jgi:histidinol-phosphate/aromatic aminotransferase/cobyric acid decarboxylase-like protein
MSEKLKELLKGHGIKVYPSTANFILIYSELPLYEKLLEKGILIRDCSNFRGLSKGFYRIAVKNRAENEAFLKAIGELT